MILLTSSQVLRYVHKWLLTTLVSKDILNTAYFECLFKVNILNKAVAHLVHVTHFFSQTRQGDHCYGWHICHKSLSEEELEKAKLLVIKSLPHECKAEEFKCIETSANLHHSSLWKLHPFIDHTGLLRVGESYNCNHTIAIRHRPNQPHHCSRPSPSGNPHCAPSPPGCETLREAFYRGCHQSIWNLTSLS